MFVLWRHRGRYPSVSGSWNPDTRPSRNGLMPSRDVNVIALVKGGERYVFLYDDDSRAEALKTLGRYAANPDLSFSWYDAAVLGQKVRLNTPRSQRAGFVSRADRKAD
jgi:hypothetical protein